MRHDRLIQAGCCCWRCAWRGGFSALMGIGGGTLGLPALSMFGMPIRRAVRTASAFGIIISIPATLMTIVLGWGVPGNPPWSLGYVAIEHVSGRGDDL